jgi:TonB-dependent receptor
MLDYQLSEKLSVLGGLRLEATSIDYTGNVYDIDTDDISAQTGTDSYVNVLPGLHFKYNASENTVVRAAWTNTLARPNYFDLTPYVAFSLSDQELERGNPELQPSVASNLDLMVENYFKSIGIVSGGAFYKNINDFIYTRRQENYSDPENPQFGTDLQFSQPENGGVATLYGFELSFQRQLDFLPGVWKGLGVYLNYTYTQSETTGVTDRESESLALPGTAGNMFNASLSFETNKLVLRASLNATSDYIDEFGGDAFNDRYYDKQLFLDFNGSYAFTPKFRMFVELNNITNQPLRYYQGVRAQTMQMEYYNMRLNFGVKFDLFGE